MDIAEEMISELDCAAIETIPNEKYTEKKWIKHQWTMEQLQVAKYTCNCSSGRSRGRDSIEKNIWRNVIQNSNGRAAWIGQPFYQ